MAVSWGASVPSTRTPMPAFPRSQALSGCGGSKWRVWSALTALRGVPTLSHPSQGRVCTCVRCVDTPRDVCSRAGEGAPPGDSGPRSPGTCPESLFLRAKLLRCLDLRHVGTHRAEGVCTLGPWLPASGLASGPLAAVGWAGVSSLFPGQPALSLCIYWFSLNVPITQASGRH